MKASEDNVLITKERYQELELKSQILDVLCRLSQRDKLAIVSLDSHELTLVGNGEAWGEKTKTTVSDIPESVIASGSVYPSDIERYRAFFRSMYEKPGGLTPAAEHLSLIFTLSQQYRLQ